MYKPLSDSKADQMIKLAIGCWALSCIYGPLGVIAQTFLIMRLVWLCDVKVIPALIICHFTGGNITFLAKYAVLLKIGITLSPAQMCLFAMFAYVVVSVMRSRFDTSTLLFICLWLPAFAPAWIMSLSAYFNNMRSLWTWPIFDVLIPVGYLWAVLAGRTWESGKLYFLKRIIVLFSMLAILRTLKVVTVWNFALTPAVICLYLLSLQLKLGTRYTVLSAAASLAGLCNLLFARYFAIEADAGYAGTAELGSSFSQIGVCAFSVFLAFGIKCRIIGKGFVRILPYVLIAITTSILLYAVSTQEKYGLVDQQYETIEGRWNAKLFNDRGTVWKEGLEEVKTPPYFIKDLRVFIDYDAVIGKDASGHYLRGYGLKLLPHNQVLYLLGRDGWWLGLTLCIFMWWMHIRAVNKATQFGDDPVFMVYFIPVSMGLFHILGLTGQSTCSAALQTHGFESTIVCGIIYGAIAERERCMRMFRREF